MNIKFLSVCRPFISLDGYQYLNRLYGGVILFAITLDKNNGLFLLANVVVKGENKDGWSFVMHCLHNAIGAHLIHVCWIFMINKQKVVIVMSIIICTFLA